MKRSFSFLLSLQPTRLRKKNYTHNNNNNHKSSSNNSERVIRPPPLPSRVPSSSSSSSFYFSLEMSNAVEAPKAALNAIHQHSFLKQLLSSRRPPTHPHHTEIEEGEDRRPVLDSKLSYKYIDNHYVMSKEQLMSAPIEEALTFIFSHQHYSEILFLLAEHAHGFINNHGTRFFSLLLSLSPDTNPNNSGNPLHHRDVPLPHVMYEDFMQLLSLASLQDAPETQFALEESINVTLLSQCAYYCSIDKDYYNSSELLWRRMTQQQRQTAAIQSAIIYITVAACQHQEAVRQMLLLAQPSNINHNNNNEEEEEQEVYNHNNHNSHNGEGLGFNKVVFSLMMHPSVRPECFHFQRQVHQYTNTYLPYRASIKSMLLQQRLCESMKYNNNHNNKLNNNNNNNGVLHTPCTPALHAALTYYMVTQQPTEKWSFMYAVWSSKYKHLLSSSSLSSSSSPLVLSDRSLHLLLYSFLTEKGIYCGKETLFYLLVELLERISLQNNNNEDDEVLLDLSYYNNNNNNNKTVSMHSMVAYILLRVKQNETFSASMRQQNNKNNNNMESSDPLLSLPSTAFEEEECELLYQMINNKKNNNNNLKGEISQTLLKGFIQSFKNEEEKEINNNNKKKKNNDMMDLFLSIGKQIRKETKRYNNNNNKIDIKSVEDHVNKIVLDNMIKQLPKNNNNNSLPLPLSVLQQSVMTKKVETKTENNNKLMETAFQTIIQIVREIEIIDHIAEPLNNNKLNNNNNTEEYYKQREKEMEIALIIESLSSSLNNNNNSQVHYTESILKEELKLNRLEEKLQKNGFWISPSLS